MHAPLFATIDIGSNSILLLIGRVQAGKLHIELQRKETVRLGGALDASNHLHPEAIQRGLECLQRYAHLMTHIPYRHRRAVATQTLREAHNRDTFMAQAQTILRCPVELISGEREASLIYQGVTRLLAPAATQRLVIDIGGRSTEICLGYNQSLKVATSCPMGSVAWAQRFFQNGSLSAQNFDAAHAQAMEQLAPTLPILQAQQWEQVLGSSGTAGAISKALHHMNYPAGEISRTGLFQLKALLIQAGHINQLPLHGLREDLRPIIGGGVSLMCSMFEAFNIEHMRIAQGALRHGLLFEIQDSLGIAL